MLYIIQNETTKEILVGFKIKEFQMYKITS